MLIALRFPLAVCNVDQGFSLQKPVAYNAEGTLQLFLPHDLCIYLFNIFRKSS